MTYSFEYRDQRGFAIEVEDEEGGNPTYMGQVYGNAETFEADTPFGAARKFRAQVDGELDPDEEE